MKKSLTFLIALLIMLSTTTYADNISYTWSFATNLSGSASNLQTVPDATIGSSIAGTAFGYTFGTVAGWARVATSPNLPTSYTPTSYVQFVVTPPTSTKLNVNSIVANLLGGGTSGVRIAAYYSFDNFATTPGTNIGNATYNGTAGKTTTTDASLNIISNSSATATLQGLTEFSPTILVNAGQSLYIRLYAWAGSASRYLSIKNVVVAGTTQAIQNTVNLTTSVSPEGSGTVLPQSGTIESGSTVSLTASKAFGYTFKEWRGGKSNTFLSNSNPISIIPTTDTAIVAVFDPIPTYSFTVNKSGTGSTWGQITLNPVPVNGKYETGTEVTMTVVPNGVTSFMYWENSATDLSRTIKVTKDTVFTPTFDVLPFIAGWDFRNTTPSSDRSGDYYSSVSNQGLLALKNQDGTSAGWLGSAGRYSPSYPCASMWTPVANWPTPRYFQATFSSVGYSNIRINSMLGASYHAYPVVDLWYSIDGTNYTKRKSVNLSTAYGSSWVQLNDTLPAIANNQAKVYVKWLPDANSTPVLGNAVDVDGTGITNVFIYADETPVPDSIAPILVSTIPAESAATVLANGSVVLTFNERVKAGTGSCTLNGVALNATFGSKTVSFPYTKLTYNSDYTFVIPSGAITDMAGNKYSGTTLHFHTMNRPTPTPKLFDAVIAADGSGNYTTVQAAIDAVPTGRTQPWLIFVKNGTYNGHVDIPATKPYINMIGQNRDSVIITGARLCGASTTYPDSVVYSVDPGATVVVKSANCYFENICFENKFGYQLQSGPQALAIYTNNDKMIFKNCWLRSYQDTYLTGSQVAGRGYLVNCLIQGAVDFIYGMGDFFFDKCTIMCTRPSGGYIVAPNHPTATKWGYVFRDCTLDGPAGQTITTYLGRPWHDRPKTSFFNTISKINIYPTGWWPKMGGIPAIFADYNTMDANGNTLDLSQRISSYQIDSVKSGVTTTYTYTGIKNSFTDTEAATYTYENVTSGSDSWDPKAIIESTDAPANVKISKSGILSWDTTPYSICYVVIKNNKVIGFTTSTSYTDGAYSSLATYNVVAVAQSGALSPQSAATSEITTINDVSTIINAYAYTRGNRLVVENVIPNSKVTVYSFGGLMLDKKTAANTTVTFDYTVPCIIKINSDRATQRLKVIR